MDDLDDSPTESRRTNEAMLECEFEAALVSGRASGFSMALAVKD